MNDEDKQKQQELDDAILDALVQRWPEIRAFNVRIQEPLGQSGDAMQILRWHYKHLREVVLTPPRVISLQDSFRYAENRATYWATRMDMLEKTMRRGGT